MNYSNRVIWITGASSGIGAALAREFSRRGARLILSARRKDALVAVREACYLPDAHVVLPLDLTDSRQIESAAAEAEAHFGHIDLLIHSAGVTQRATAVETQMAVDRMIMEVNYFGPVALTKATLPSMLARGKGRIVVISSLAGRISTPYRSAHAASKHALHGFFDALRAEIASQGVGVTLICPGYVRTDVSVNAFRGDGSRYGRLDDMQARGMSPEACAGAIVRAINRKKDEVNIGGRETWAILLFRLFPKLYRRLVRDLHVVPTDVSAEEDALAAARS